MPRCMRRKVEAATKCAAPHDGLADQMAISLNKRIRWHGMPVKITLCFLAALLSQETCLFFSFNAFSDDL